LESHIPAAGTQTRGGADLRFFRVVDGEIKEIRPYFDPTPLKAAA